MTDFVTMTYVQLKI